MAVQASLQRSKLRRRQRHQDRGSQSQGRSVFRDFAGWGAGSVSNGELPPAPIPDWDLSHPRPF